MDHPRVTLTNADKVLYPPSETSAAVTKAEVFGYYTGIAEVMLPHLAGRPATRKRWPDGVLSDSFFEKQLPTSAPRWLHRGQIAHKTRTTTYPILDSVDALAWIAQQAALEVHVPQWRFENGKPGPATRLVFDLDPGEGVALPMLAEVARAIRDLLADIGLTSFPVTSGSRGLHVYATLDRPVSSPGAVAVARRVADQLERDMPGRVTATMAKSVRAGRVFVDWSQNNAAKTTCSPYSLRGRRQPTVAAPRTWAELDDPALGQLRYDEVLARAVRDGDLLAALDDRLHRYRSRRNPAQTPEPAASVGPSGGDAVFVIQEHHARRLHYDFRLARDGVLLSWAVPKNLPDTPSVNHLAVRTEDHPLEYATFEGTIPAGEYGAGRVSIWDSGGYDTEKFGADEIVVVLHGDRVSGRYALIRTGGDQWLVHRMKDQSIFEFSQLEPMLATHGPVAHLDAQRWAFEGKFDGYRMLVAVDHGSLRLRSRGGRDVTDEFRQLQPLAAALADHRAVFDGEVVALDDDGVPSFSALQHRAADTPIEFWAFDLLYLDGRPLVRAGYRDRRRLLEILTRDTDLVVPELLPGDGAQALATARQRGWEGVVAKQWDATYRPGCRTRTWIKDKFWNTQDVVIGGWRRGARSSGIGALLLGIPGAGGLDAGGLEAGGLEYVGRVGTGFTGRDLADLQQRLAPLHAAESPFKTPLSDRDTEGVSFVRPVLVGEVRYRDWTTAGRLRQASWRGLRPDKTAEQVVRE